MAVATPGGLQVTGTGPGGVAGAATRDAGPQVPQAAPEGAMPEGMMFEMSEEEKALIKGMTALLGVQTDYASTQLAQYKRLLPRAEQLWQAQATFAAVQNEYAGRQLPERHESYMTSSRILQNLSNDPVLNKLAQGVLANDMAGKSLEALTPKTQGLFDSIYDERRQTGTAALRQQAEELASARGLRMTDTPIGGDVFLRNLSEFERGLGAEQAGAELGLMTQQQQHRSAVAQFQRNMSMAAAVNRAQLAAGSSGGGGMPGLPTVQTGDANPGAALSAMSANRGQQANYLLGQQQLASQQAIAAGNNQTALGVANINRQGPSRSWQDYVVPIVGNMLGSGAQGLF